MGPINPTTFTYNDVTHYVGGLAIDPADIEKYQILIGTTPGGPYPVVIDDVEREAGSLETTSINPHTLSSGQKYGRVRVQMLSGAVSDLSPEEVQFEIVAIPQAPTGFSVGSSAP
jgi:hypothetical protein